jgi:RNA-directed DNA polymerase
MDGESKPTGVCRESGTKQAGDIRARWGWVEPCVWTERMLTALETGVRGGQWFSLIDKVWDERNLRAAFRRVKANKGAAGVDHVSIEDFEKELDENVAAASRELREGSYQPQPVARRYIRKPGSRERRPLGVPTVRDRMVEGAARQVIEPIFEKEFLSCSYGFRPERGCKDALREVVRLLREGTLHVLEVDFRKYFDSIPWDPLIKRVGERISDGRMLKLIGQFLQHGVMEEGRRWEPEEGTPQGAVISPLLANIYLHSLDQCLTGKGYHIIRFADDLVVLCRSRAEAEGAMDALTKWATEAGLLLHPDKTQIVDMNTSGAHFDFLGYRFTRTRGGTLNWWPRPKSMRKLKDRLRAETRRANGRSLDEIIRRINPTLRGWYEYFKHAYRTTFAIVDSWVRMRLRSILRKRRGLRGRGRGSDHHRWPNVYFAEHGLFSTLTTYQYVCQSARR